HAPEGRGSQGGDPLAGWLGCQQTAGRPLLQRQNACPGDAAPVRPGEGERIAGARAQVAESESRRVGEEAIEGKDKPLLLWVSRGESLAKTKAEASTHRGTFFPSPEGVPTG